MNASTATAPIPTKNLLVTVPTVSESPEPKVARGFATERIKVPFAAPPLGRVIEITQLALPIIIEYASPTSKLGTSVGTAFWLDLYVNQQKVFTQAIELEAVGASFEGTPIGWLSNVYANLQNAIKIAHAATVEIGIHGLGPPAKTLAGTVQIRFFLNQVPDNSSEPANGNGAFTYIEEDG